VKSADAFRAIVRFLPRKIAAARAVALRFFCRRISARAPHAPDAMGDVARSDETLEYGGVVNPAALVFGTSVAGFSPTATTRATPWRSDGTLSILAHRFSAFSDSLQTATARWWTPWGPSTWLTCRRAKSSA
jgi:hypothetical protein